MYANQKETAVILCKQDLLPCCGVLNDYSVQFSAVWPNYESEKGLRLLSCPLAKRLKSDALESSSMVDK